MACLVRMDVTVRADLVRLGAACHDAGKVVYPEELDAPGSMHEAAGETLPLEHGMRADVARCCVSHARHDVLRVEYEELLVALADKLWKGRWAGALERRVVAETAARLDRPE